MITLEDCIALCGLTEEEVLAIAEHEHLPEIASTALDLLKNLELREGVVAESQQRARERLSFGAVSTQLAKFFGSVQSHIGF